MTVDAHVGEVFRRASETALNGKKKHFLFALCLFLQQADQVLDFTAADFFTFEIFCNVYLRQKN